MTGIGRKQRIPRKPSLVSKTFMANSQDKVLPLGESKLNRGPYLLPSC
jgi:hypothetical protein